MEREPFTGIFFDDELADWAVWIAIAVACAVLVMIIPLESAI